MKIFAYFPHPLEGSLGSTVRIRELYGELHREGHEVGLYSPYEKGEMAWGTIPLRNASRGLLSGDAGRRFTYALSRRAYYSRLFAFVYGHPEVLARLQESSARPLEKALRGGGRPDFLLAEDCVSIGPCLRVGRKLELPVIADIHNPTPEELVSAGLISEGGSSYRALRRWLKDQMNEVDGVVVVSEEMKMFVHQSYGVPLEKMAVVPPAGKVLDFDPAGRNERRTVVYSGMLAYREHVDLFIDSIPFVTSRTEGASFRLTRKGDMLSEVRRRIGRLKADVALFWFDDASFYPFLASCSVGVAPSSNDQARRMGTPIKLLDYMSVGLPIVANRIGGWTDMIDENDIGITTEDSPKEFADAIVTLLEDEDTAIRMGNNGMRLVRERMNWAASAKAFIDFATRIIDSS